MEKMAQFEKVSFLQFKKDFLETFPSLQEKVEEIYQNLQLPKRATRGSAGYDFFSPLSFCLNPRETIKIPTGIRCKMKIGWVLEIFPRSGLGFKYRLQLNNTVGIIDSDYYDSSNEGHIFIKITNDSNESKTVSIRENEGFAQGIFLPFGITMDDEVEAKRDGGFGSTTQR